MNYRNADIEMRLADARDRVAVRVFLGRVSVVADPPRLTDLDERDSQAMNVFSSIKRGWIYGFLPQIGIKLRMVFSSMSRKVPMARCLSLLALGLIALMQPILALASVGIVETLPASITTGWANWLEFSPAAQDVWKRVVRESDEGQIEWMVCWPPTPSAQHPNLVVFALCRRIDNFKLGWALIVAESRETDDALLTLHQLIWDLYGLGKGEWLWVHSPMNAH